MSYVSDVIIFFENLTIPKLFLRKAQDKIYLKKIIKTNQILLSCFDKSLACILATLPNVIFDTNPYKLITINNHVMHPCLFRMRITYIEQHLISFVL